MRVLVSDSTSSGPIASHSLAPGPINSSPPTSSVAQVALSFSRVSSGVSLEVTPQEESLSIPKPRRAKKRGRKYSSSVTLELVQPVSTEPRLVEADPGDHPAISQWLTAVFQNGSREAFLASLDDPYNEPRDRLLVKTGEQILAHAYLYGRVANWGEAQIPIGGLKWLGTLAEYRGRGFARQLVHRAEENLRREGMLVGWLSTRIPHFFRSEGWVLCGRHSQARAGCRDILAQLSEAGHELHDSAWTIRPWRQVELSQLMEVYSQALSQRTSHGMIRAGLNHRTESYWRWLVSHKHFDQIFVAVEETSPAADEIAPARILGYAVMKEDRILELFSLPDQPQVPRQLLARACGEAIERNLQTVVLNAPPCDPLFGLFQAAGGEVQYREVHQGTVHMARLLDPCRAITAFSEEWHRRAQLALLPRPCELGLRIEDQKYRLVLSRQGIRLQEGKSSRSYLRTNMAEFTRLLLGHHSAAEAITLEKIVPSNKHAAHIALALFPKVSLWRPPLDELMV